MHFTWTPMRGEKGEAARPPQAPAWVSDPAKGGKRCRQARPTPLGAIIAANAVDLAIAAAARILALAKKEARAVVLRSAVRQGGGGDFAKTCVSTSTASPAHRACHRHVRGRRRVGLHVPTQPAAAPSRAPLVPPPPASASVSAASCSCSCSSSASSFSPSSSSSSPSSSSSSSSSPSSSSSSPSSPSSSSSSSSTSPLMTS